MYCNHCGSQLPMGAQYCPNCQSAVAVVKRFRVKNQLTLLSALWFAMGALRLFAAVIVFVISGVLASVVAQHAVPFPVHYIIFGVGVLVAAIGALSLAVGWGLNKREPWARTLALVMAFFSLFSIPFGTALGIYTLVVLLPDEAAEEWEIIKANR